MAQERRLIPDGKQVTLEELLPGTIFAFGDDCIAVKSEYRCSNGLIEAFIIDSGEQFWGGAKTAKEQNELMVQPLAIDEVDAVPVEQHIELQKQYIELREQYDKIFTEFHELRDAFIDYVCSGIPNPSPFCKNRCEGCLNSWGWCQSTDACKGFNPGEVILDEMRKK